MWVLMLIWEAWVKSPQPYTFLSKHIMSPQIPKAASLASEDSIVEGSQVVVKRQSVRGVEGS